MVLRMWCVCVLGFREVSVVGVYEWVGIVDLSCGMVLG